MKGQQLVAVVFVLLLTGGDFGGQAASQVVAKSVETVEDRDDTGLRGKAGNGNLCVGAIVIV